MKLKGKVNSLDLCGMIERLKAREDLNGLLCSLSAEFRDTSHDGASNPLEHSYIDEHIFIDDTLDTGLIHNFSFRSC